MSTKPHPVALTSAMLTARYADYTANAEDRVFQLASLASTLHRLAKGCQRQAVAECNGEFWGGQREAAYRYDVACKADRARGVVYNRTTQGLDDAIAQAGQRLDKRIAKLNALLAPLALEARRYGDPRGSVLRLCSTDKSKPVPCNCGDGESWAIT